MRNESITFLKRLAGIVLVCMLLFTTGCKKEIDPAIAGLKITLIDGNNQTDTVGKSLKKPLIFKITEDGLIVSNCYVRIETYDCDNNLQIIEQQQYGLASALPYPDSLHISFDWKLNGITGAQYLRAFILDSNKQPKDSVTVTATAVKPTKGWYSSGCLPLNRNGATFCKLPSGRILTAFRDADFPYYSDDEGVTWHALKTLPDIFAITKMIATPLNEVFLSTAHGAMYYSNNGGQSWDRRTSGLPVSVFSGDIYYTKSEKLFAFTTSGIFLSTDKGLTWHQVTYGLSYYAGFSDASSLSDGTIFAIHDNHLVQSSDGGEGWSEVWSISNNTGLKSLFVDDNDDIYVGSWGSPSVTDGLYVSKNKGQSWTRIYRATPISGFDRGIYQISKYNGSYYFYATSAHVLLKTNDFNNYTTISPPVSNNNGKYSYRYIVSNNNHWILSTEFYGIYYYIP